MQIRREDNLRSNNKHEVGSQTFQRGLDCLLALASSDHPLSVAEIAAAVDVPESTVYRLLRPLEQRGLVERTDQGKRVLGLRVLELCKGLRRSHRLNINEIARPIMQQLADVTQETVILTQVIGLEAICVENIESAQPIRLSFDRGRVQPIHAGASAKILLAFSDRGFQEKVLNRCNGRAYADGVPVDCEKLRQELAQIREQRFAVTTGELDLGATAVAAPILGKDSSLVAGLSVAGPRDRFGTERLPGLIELTVAMSRQISERHSLISTLHE
jgi:IclR family KDG regulon transcriptional repressor